MHRALAAAAVAALSVAPLGASAADVPVKVFVDGRGVDRHGASAINHQGVTYIDSVRAVRTFNGLLTFTGHDAIRVTIQGRTMTFTVGKKTALLENQRIPLQGAPFKLNGEIYIPLTNVAKLAGAQLYVDMHALRAQLSLNKVESYPSPQASIPGSLEEDAPSPLQALKFGTTFTVEAGVLHAHLSVLNTLDKAYKIAFPTQRQFAFVLSQNGNEVWNSATEMAPGEPSSFSIDANETKTIEAEDTAFGKLGPGRFTLRVRLMTSPPLDLTPISLGVETASPR